MTLCKVNECTELKPRKGFPREHITKAESDERASIEKDGFTYITEMSAKFITGVEPLSNYLDFKSKLSELGYGRVGKIIEARAARAKK